MFNDNHFSWMHLSRISAMWSSIKPENTPGNVHLTILKLKTMKQMNGQ